MATASGSHRCMNPLASLPQTAGASQMKIYQTSVQNGKEGIGRYKRGKKREYIRRQTVGSGYCIRGGGGHHMAISFKVDHQREWAR